MSEALPTYARLCLSFTLAAIADTAALLLCVMHSKGRTRGAFLATGCFSCATAMPTAACTIAFGAFLFRHDVLLLFGLRFSVNQPAVLASCVFTPFHAFLLHKILGTPYLIWETPIFLLRPLCTRFLPT